MRDDPHPTFLSKKLKGYRKWVILFVLIFVGALALYRGWGAIQKKSGKRSFQTEIPVQISPVIRKQMTYSLTVTGDIAPMMQVDLFPKVSGYLERIDVNLGDSARQGQGIAQIDRADFLQKVKEVEAKVAQAKANLSELEAGSRPEELRQAEEALRQAQSRFDNAKLHRERIEALFKRQVISKKEADIAEMDYTVAEAQLAASQQNLKLVREGARQEVREGSRAKLKEMEALLAQEQIRLQNTLIVAPFQGEIIRKYIDAGALVSPSTPIVNLVHTMTLKIVANVLEKDIPLLKPAMKAKIRTEAYPDRVFEGKVARINTGLDLTTRTLQAEIEIPNSSRLLKPGMFARIEVVLLEKPQVLAIPSNAVIVEQGEQFVYVVEGNKAVRKPVVTGIEQDRFVEVREGLKEGDQVIVRGQEAIRENTTIKVIEGS
ncbi:MAG: efflux RND transporter periplasmic adaptor subunit [Deltaproteobacteria bacterium]|nr:efflux RND transporter periplasmic adaptor subunit [Deltaproteobacteria bacterium]